MQVTDRHHERAAELNEQAWAVAKLATAAALTPAQLSEIVADDLKLVDPDACQPRLVADLLVAVAHGKEYLPGTDCTPRLAAARMLYRLVHDYAEDSTKRPREITADEVAEDEAAEIIAMRRAAA